MDKFRKYLAAYQAKPMGEERVYAVFLPLIRTDGEWQVLYQVRGKGISQAGEVSFPGGAVETGESLKEAAIRETLEELCIDSSQIEVWGQIDYVVHPKRTIHCFVGQLFVEDWQNIQPNSEVERLFTVPLRYLQEHPPVYHTLDMAVQPDSLFPFERIDGGANYRFSHYLRHIPFYETLDENLWGLTAQFTHRFVEMMEEIL